MRVLVANKFWYRRGGLERVMFDEIAWLEAAGNEVVHFSTAHPENIVSPWSEYFVPYLELGSGGMLTSAQKVRAAARMLHNHDAALRFGRLLAKTKPDVVHIHGIHRQISPSILDVAKRAHIPVVQTLHDYHHVCPADVLLRGGDGVCTPRACGVLDYLPALKNRCVHGSLSMSALSALETAFQRGRHVYERSISTFICPSGFMREVMVDGGWEADKMRVVANAVPLTTPGTAKDYVLFAGRLSPEKGIDVLLRAAVQANVRVVVAGDGPLGETLRARYPGTEFLGRVDGAQVASLMASALVVAVPSVCYENAPMSVLEAMAAGVPVVASAIGGIPEQVEDGVSGLLVLPDDVDALATALARVVADGQLRERLGAAARARVAQEFSPEQHLRGLLKVYEDVLAS